MKPVRQLTPFTLFAICLMPLFSHAADTVVTATFSNTFSVAHITIEAGDTVTWISLQPTHNVARSASPAANVWNGTGFRSGAVGLVDSYPLTFFVPGVFYYICEPHAVCCGMKGSVTVLAALNPNNVFANFNAETNGNGAEDTPFDNLQEALDAANANAVINLEPGSTTETFTGAGVISKALTLRNNTPGGGSVIIGGVSAKSEDDSGFRSRQTKDDETL